MRKLILILVAALPAIVHAQSVHDLDFLIGTWDVHEVTYPGTSKEYIETGKRQCEYALDGTYIKCETKAIRHGKNRVYVFLINYLKSQNRFQMISLFSDYPQQGKYNLLLDKNNFALQIISVPDIPGDDSFTRSTISYSESGKLIWEGWSSAFTESKEWKLLYREVSAKIK